MTTRDELIVKFTADVGDFNRRLSEVQSKVTQLNNNVSKQTGMISSSFKKMGAAIGAYLTVGAIVNFTSSVVNLASKMNDLSNRTGIALDPLQRLNSLATVTGVSIESIARSTQMLGKRLVENGKDVQTAINYLGLSMSDLRAASPDKQLLMISILSFFISFTASFPLLHLSNRITMKQH